MNMMSSHIALCVWVTERYPEIIQCFSGSDLMFYSQTKYFQQSQIFLFSLFLFSERRRETLLCFYSSLAEGRIIWPPFKKLWTAVEVRFLWLIQVKKKYKRTLLWLSQFSRKAREGKKEMGRERNKKKKWSKEWRKKNLPHDTFPHQYSVDLQWTEWAGCPCLVVCVYW